MPNLINAVQNYLDAQEWKYSYNEEDNYFTMRMNLKTVDSCAVYIQMRDDDAVTVYSVFPVKVSEEHRGAVAEFIARANYGLIHGNFELDYRDGEIRYKVTTACGDIDLEESPMDRTVNTGFCMLDRYGEGILSVLYGNVSPAEAIEKIEGGDDEDDEDDEASDD